jgi:hypothetical protein
MHIPYGSRLLWPCTQGTWFQPGGQFLKYVPIVNSWNTYTNCQAGLKNGMPSWWSLAAVICCRLPHLVSGKKPRRLQELMTECHDYCLSKVQPLALCAGLLFVQGAATAYGHCSRPPGCGWYAKTKACLACHPAGMSGWMTFLFYKEIT